MTQTGEISEATESHIDDVDLTFAQAARLLPKRVAPIALWRWARYGLKAADGTRVKLSVRRYGRQLYTTRRALREFGEELAQRDLVRWEGQEGPPRRKTPAKPTGRRGDDDQLNAELEAKGY